jgi:hypothetical protein
MCIFKTNIPTIQTSFTHFTQRVIIVNCNASMKTMFHQTQVVGHDDKVNINCDEVFILRMNSRRSNNKKIPKVALRSRLYAHTKPNLNVYTHIHTHLYMHISVYRPLSYFCTCQPSPCRFHQQREVALQKPRLFRYVLLFVTCDEYYNDYC